LARSIPTTLTFILLSACSICCSHALEGRAGAVHSISWRKEYGGLRLDQAKRLKELEKENARLKKLVANQVLDNAILKEISSGNF
jgi:hypothetical protein